MNLIKASKILTPALNNLIADNISSFPLSSTFAGISGFDWSTGDPISIRESLGPIFAETGKTIGKNKINIGSNYSNINFTNIRGLPIQDIQFLFTHANVRDTTVLGDVSSESDLLNVHLNTDINAGIFAVYATFGLGDNFDMGIAISICTCRYECRSHRYHQ